MENRLRKALLTAVDRYYTPGLPSRENWDLELDRLVAEKVNETSDSVRQWSALVDKLRSSLSIQVHNHSFLQFPNLSLLVESKEVVNDVTILRNFQVFLSLLCPFYTYYYEYQHRVKVSGGKTLFVGSHAFFSTPEFRELKLPFSEAGVSDLLSAFFPDYSYCNHYELMLFEIDGVVPYRADPAFPETDRHSMFQVLFNNEQPENFHP